MEMVTAYTNPVNEAGWKSHGISSGDERVYDATPCPCKGWNPLKGFHPISATCSIVSEYVAAAMENPEGETTSSSHWLRSNHSVYVASHSLLLSPWALGLERAEREKRRVRAF